MEPEPAVRNPSTKTAGPTGDGWREEMVRFAGGAGNELIGILTRPATGTEKPATAVVVLHGWGAYRSGPHRILVELCRELARAGLPALRFDISGRGDSGGEFWNVGLDEMIADARAAGDFLLSATGADSLSAAGICSGANVALGAAAGDARFTAVAAMSALPFQEHRGSAQGRARARGALRELIIKAFSVDTWKRFFRGEVAVGRILRRLTGGEGGKSASAGGEKKRNLKASSRDIQAELAGFSGRLLFIHGGADAEGVSGWKEVFEPFMKARKITHRHMLIAGADHDYHDLNAKQEAIAAAVSFLSGRN